MRKELQAVACVGCLATLSIPAPAAAGQTPGGAAGQAHGSGARRGFASAAESRVVALTNAARARNGCRAVVHDPKLHLAAERHSADMARRNYFSHTSRDGRTFGQRIKATGFAFRRAAENIAQGQPTAAAVVKAWLHSPGHRANLLNCAYTHIGVGHHPKGPTWTQDFGAR
ncbi:CAP domain-containing protein [[Actinomadura] parvosata]|uniref:CAP domain-containing protein n=1 Tax=[Actinomadura] parvosata TaxID=1955412 RepID=UPI00406D3A10